MLADVPLAPAAGAVGNTFDMIEFWPNKWITMPDGFGSGSRARAGQSKPLANTRVVDRINCLKSQPPALSNHRPGTAFRQSRLKNPSQPLILGAFMDAL
jgi:hypothetical protein